jgi:hypothetical protein
MDDYRDGANARMCQKYVKCAGDNGATADFPVLFRSITLACPLASTGGDDDHGDLFICCHGYSTLSVLLVARGLQAAVVDGQRNPKSALLCAYALRNEGVLSNE